MQLSSKVKFIDEKLKESYERLRNSNSEDKFLYENLRKAFSKIEQNAFCGIQISKKQIPKEYLKKYKIDNCWKLNLPKGWRLIYAVESNNIIVLSIILDWFSHKKYSEKFNYKRK